MTGKTQQMTHAVMYALGAFTGAGLIAHIDATGMPGVEPLVVVLLGLLGAIMFTMSMFGFWNMEPLWPDST